MDLIWALHRNPDHQGRACMMHVMMMWVQKLCGVYLHSWHQSCMLLSVPTLTLGHNLTCSPGVLLCIHLTSQISHFFNRFAFIYTQICSQCNQISSWEKEFYIYISQLHLSCTYNKSSKTVTQVSPHQPQYLSMMISILSSTFDVVYKAILCWRLEL